jgi:hypothetical protein
MKNVLTVLLGTALVVSFDIQASEGPELAVPPGTGH